MTSTFTQSIDQGTVSTQCTKAYNYSYLAIHLKMAKKTMEGGRTAKPEKVVARTSFDSIKDLTEHADEIGKILFRFALLRKRDEERAKDLVQDTFVKALENAEQFTGGSLLSWLFRILQNRDIDMMRSSKVKEWLYTDTLSGNEVSVAATQDSSMEFKDLERVLETLPPQDQLMINLVAQQFKYEEIAEMLDIPMGTVMSHLHRLRNHLRKTTGRGT